MRHFKVDRGIDRVILLVLTLLVWGLYPFTRGIRFASDDVNWLFLAWWHVGQPLGQQLLVRYTLDGWTRALAFWPFVLATNTPEPVVFLRVFYGAVWLLNGLAIGYLARVLWPRSRLAPMVAGCLMVTATSDFMTDSVVFGPFLLGIALFFFGTAQLLRSAETEGGAGRAVWAAVLLAWSFFTVEYTYPVVPLLPFLVWLHARPGWSARFYRSLVVLALTFLPAVVVLVLAPSVNATSVFLPPIPLRLWLSLVVAQTVHNVWPLAWAFRPIPPWYDNFAAVFPRPVFVALAMLGAALAYWRFRHYCRLATHDDAAPFSRLAGLVGFACVTIVALAVGSAALGGDYFVRSHFVSRGWTSLGLALLLGGLARLPRWRLWSGLVFAAFVFFGIWGGIERQSYLLAYAKSERRELRSLREAVPGFEPPAHLVIIQPPGSPSFIATNNPNTIAFVYGDLALNNQVVLAPNSGFDYSTIEGNRAGLIRVLVDSKRETIVDPANCILVFYSPSQQRFIRLDQVPAGLLRGSASFFKTYQPQRLLGPPTDRTPKAVLDFLAHDGLASADRPVRKTTPYPGMLSLSPSLAGRIEVDSLTPYVLEPQGIGHIVWLGASRAEGYSSLVWARDPVSATLSIRLTRGPGLAASDRLVVRLTTAAGAEHLVTQRFETGPTTYTMALDLARGVNILELWLEGPDPSLSPPGPSLNPPGETRNLNGYLEQMSLGTAASSIAKQ